MIHVTGTLRTGEKAEMHITQLDVGDGRHVWHQRATSSTAKHLQRDYVCQERVEDVLEWLPCDWAVYTVCVDEGESFSSVCGGEGAVHETRRVPPGFVSVQAVQREWGDA